MSGREATHPYIGFLVEAMKTILGLIETESRGIALNYMRAVLYSVESSARNKENWKALDKNIQGAISSRRKVADADPIVLRGKLDSFDYHFMAGYMGLWSDLWLILWDNGYMHENTFMGIIPARTLEKTKETPEMVPFPERLSEDLE